jgi:hypothetical protein
MYKKAILLGLLGYIAGCIIGLCFALSSEGFGLTSSLPQILLGGIPGAIAMGSVVIYDVEEWSILRATVTHFLVAMGAILFGCFVLGWFKPWSTSFWIMLAIEFAAYLLIWLIMYRCFRAKVRKLNELLKENREKENSRPD